MKIHLSIQYIIYFIPAHLPARDDLRCGLCSDMLVVCVLTCCMVCVLTCLWLFFRDALIAALQQQIADLQLYLEEERLNHRITRQQVISYLMTTTAFRYLTTYGSRYQYLNGYDIWSSSRSWVQLNVDGVFCYQYEKKFEPLK